MLRKRLAQFSGAVAGLFALIVVYVFGGLYEMGYRSLSEMDWNDDGFTSPSEILSALDIAKVRKGNCVEYIDAKDGIKTYAFRCDQK